jgi:site-specific DNA-methyltransferase (adenine-specific)
MKNLPATKPKESAKPIACGDIFQVGDHIIACGDSLDVAFVDRVIGNRKIASVISDVPYGIKAVESKEGFGHLSVPKAILNDDITDETAYTSFTEAWIKPILPHLERKNSFYIFNADPMIFALREGMRKSGLTFSQLLIWVKTHAVIGRKDYAPQHELIAYGWYGVHKFQKPNDKSVIVHPKPAKNPLHPTQKPVGLIRRLVLNGTRMGDIVFDGFAGSGTLGLAAHQTGRKAILIERDEAYVQTILNRFKKVCDLDAQLLQP